jgi:hypothetical protein
MPEERLVPHRGLKAAPQANRRRGQALLLAVLIMVFAALLGATFITVVAINLNQTARGENQRIAEQNAAAGLSYINTQLIRSTQGENWRPETSSPPPLPSDPSYSDYYTEFDRAMGWARQSGSSQIFVKFPDPRVRQASSAPSFMAAVQRIEDTSDARYGMLEIEVIGLAPDDANVYSRQSAYKPTSWRGGPLAYARYDANYDLQHEQLLQTNVAQDVTVNSTSPTAVAVTDTSGFAPGRTVMVPRSPQPISMIVNGVDATNRTLSVQLLSTSSTTAELKGGELLRAASNMLEGLFNFDADNRLAPLKLDADGDGSSSQSYETTAPQPYVASANGMHINNGLYARGNTNVTLSSATGTTLDIAGLLDAEAEQGIVDAAAGPTPVPMSSSPLVKTVRNAAADVMDPHYVRPLAPPVLPAEDDSRYRELTRYADVSDGSPYGYGPGLYIDNVDDVEKVESGGAYRPLLISDLQRWWQRKSFPVASGSETGNYSSNQRQRLVWPRIGVDTYTYPLSATNLSLEQRGLRGWVTPYEFRPRGTLIELQGDTIVITREDRSERATQAPDPTKGWRDPDGTLLNKVYRMVLDTATGTRRFGAPGNEVTFGNATPFNGVIYAEGNLRVRGWIADKSLTIVSMGNIYIEGSVRRTSTGRIALVARRNVALNPTQLLGRAVGVQDADVASSSVTLQAAASNSNTIAVNDIAPFRVADYVRVVDTTASATGSTPWVTITNLSGLSGPGTLTVSAGVTMPQGSTVQLLTEMPQASDSTTKESYYSVANPGDVVIREAKLDRPDTAVPAAPYYLSLLHAGEKSLAFQLNHSAAAETVNVKTDDDGDSKVTTTATPSEKHMRAVLSPGNFEFDFDLLQVTSNTTAGDSTQTLSLLNSQFPLPDNFTPKWTITNLVAQANTIAARRLATVSQSASSASPLPLPLTVSLGLFWNPASGPNVSGAPTFPIGSSLQPTDDEDLASVRESFYWRPDPNDPTARLQSGLKWHSHQVTATAPGSDTLLALSRDTAVNLPAYRLAALKLERDDFNVTSPAVADGATRDFNALDIKVEATIFAQQGSWFVIPPPVLNPRLDSDEDGTVSAAELAAATHYRRPNVEITVVGNISQNFSPTAAVDYDTEPDGDGNTGGAMREWIDAVSYPQKILNSSNSGYGTQWTPIQYQGEAIPLNDTSLYLPVSPDLTIER